jgi:hypothetical protein
MDQGESQQHQIGVVELPHGFCIVEFLFGGFIGVGGKLILQLHSKDFFLSTVSRIF